MAKIIIDKQKCKGCLLCVNVCPKRLIKKSSFLNKRGLNYIEFTSADKCTGCLMCAVICPDCCIEAHR